jgi:hypothetical protein
MPRIFHVTFTKEFETTIVAEDENEVQGALDKCLDFDDWCDTEWDFSISDPLSWHKNPENVPRKFNEPDMGIDAGEAVNIYDYQKTHPDYMEKVEADAAEHARKLHEAKTQAKIPGTETCILSPSQDLRASQIKSHIK